MPMIKEDILDIGNWDYFGTTCSNPKDFFPSHRIYTCGAYYIRISNYLHDCLRFNLQCDEKIHIMLKGGKEVLELSEEELIVFTSDFRKKFYHKVPKTVADVDYPTREHSVLIHNKGEQ